ncbi:MAG: thiamine biosynthesis protein ThiS [Nitrospiraceae bacterium]
MKVRLSHPERQIEVKGPKRVQDLLRDFNLLVEAHLVIRGSDLMTEDEVIADSDSIEIRPVISGGSPRLVNLPAGRGLPFHPGPAR